MKNSVLLHSNFYKRNKSCFFKQLYSRVKYNYRQAISEAKKLHIAKNIEKSGNKFKKVWNKMISVTYINKKDNTAIFPEEFN